MNAQLVLPSSNPSGQAQHTIAGFRYQLLQSMLALLQLRQGDQLCWRSRRIIPLSPRANRSISR
jgi:hypothetical protein